jgi:hypothetical protein
VQVQTLSINPVAFVVSFKFIFLHSIIDYKKFNTSSKGKKVARTHGSTHKPTNSDRFASRQNDIKSMRFLIGMNYGVQVRFRLRRKHGVQYLGGKSSVS